MSVPEHLSAKLSLSEKFICTWDHLHKSGLVDAHIRVDSNSKWLVEIQSYCREIYTLFNWGKNYDDLVEVCTYLDIEMRKLTNFQSTRFANSVRFVFINLGADYTAVRQCLKNVIESKEYSSNAEERAKAGAVKTVLRVINSSVFCLCLAGCADTYNLYGQLANVCQQVDILPRERYDTANALISKFVKMIEAVNHKDCPPDDASGKKCIWPNYHGDLPAMDMDNKYMESTIDHVIMGKPRQTRSQTSDGEGEIADGIALVRESLTTLAWRLHNDLKADAFDEDTKKMTENIRVVCDLKNVLSNIKEKGSAVLGLQNSAKFLNAVRCITDSVHTISDEDHRLLNTRTGKVKFWENYWGPTFHFVIIFD